jgi:hypothetical protein
MDTVGGPTNRCGHAGYGNLNMHKALLTLLLVGGLLNSVFAENSSADAGSSDQQTDSSNSKGTTINTEGLKNGCFYARDASNWDALNREYLIVYAPSKTRPFLVHIAPPSVELRNAITLGFGGRDRICGKAGEHLEIGGGMGRRYSIMDVKRLDKETALQMKDRLQAREKGTVAPATESPGAELETVIQPDKQDTVEVNDKPTEGSVQDEQEVSSE